MLFYYTLHGFMNVSVLESGRQGSSCFRMFTKTQDVIYVQTEVNLVSDMWTHKARFIISRNVVLP